MSIFTNEDKRLLNDKGISEEDVNKQLTQFEVGFPYLDIVSAATVTSGIYKLTTKQKSESKNRWNTYKTKNHKVFKFVPASGAASRMFKDLFSFLDASYSKPTKSAEVEFFDNLSRFAFYGKLDAICKQNEQLGCEELLSKGQYKNVISNFLLPKGLNYGGLPKGLLQFHRYEGGENRTPMEEHLSEAILYAVGADQNVNLHFTVSPEHRTLFEDLLHEKKTKLENKFGVILNVSFSEQKSSTDTIAVNEDNTPFRNEDGTLLFRPGGHGALIENLNDLDCDIVFVKNIDNVVPDRLKALEVEYKNILAGVLVEKQAKSFEYLNLLENGKYSHEDLIEMIYFLQNELCLRNVDIKHLEDSELVLYIKEILNRPMRVCGMVKNVGEPGGGPFLTKNSKGIISLQILETSQIDLTKDENRNILANSTHFNPVDLVCSLKDYKGNNFNLCNFIDKNTGFVSLKSKDGKNLKALELPGLWNGAMSEWNTMFVEMPIDVFNPVKTVNDLLREKHL